MSTASPPRICVVGAGITGLAAAWEVHRSAPDAGLVVLEAADRPGGVIGTSPFAGHPTDEGADAFLARVDDATRLCAELGLADDLVAPATGHAFVHLDGALVPLPGAHFLGVPLDPDDLDTRLLSPAGRAALRADLARAGWTRACTAGTGGTGGRGIPESDGGDGDAPGPPGSRAGAPPAADCSIGALVRDRLGDEVLERLVGPLVGSINAGDCDRLSLHAAAPALAEAARSDASLIRALRRRAAASRADEPVFWGLRGGMERLPATLAERLAPALALGEPALALQVRRGDAGDPEIRRVDTRDRSIRCDAVVLATGACRSARLVEPWAPEAAALLGRTGTASVAIVTLAYEASAVPGARAGSGFLVPPSAGLDITACSWASTKWAHLGLPRAGDSGDDLAILRVSLGRHGDDAIVGKSDDVLIDAARAGLAATMGAAAEPSATRVSRWPDAFPQYAVGHVERTAAVEETLGAAGVFCAGASYHGIGIPACIGSGRRAARAALARARNRPLP